MATSKLLPRPDIAASNNSQIKQKPPRLLTERVSMAQRCHADALHSIFGFLSLKELLPSLRLCRFWRDAGYKEPSRGLTCALPVSLWPLLPLLPLRHHVRGITLKRRSSAHVGRCSLADVQVLAPLGTLRALTLMLDSDCLQQALSLLPASMRDGFVRAFIPPTITELTLSVDDGATQPAQQLLLSSVGGLSNLRLLSLSLSSIRWLDLSPLMELIRLEHLNFSGCFSLPPPSCKALRSLKSLVTLDIMDGKWTASEMQLLLATGHQLHLLSCINLDQTAVSKEHVHALASLPCLTALAPKRVLPDAQVLLPMLRSLVFMGLSLANEPGDSSLIAHISQFHLTELHLSHGCLTSFQVVLLSSMPTLTRLQLSDVEVDLQSLSVTRALTHLTLDSCPKLRLSSLLPLARCASLRELHVQLRSSKVDIAFARAALPLLLPHVHSICITELARDKSSRSGHDDDHDEEDAESDEIDEEEHHEDEEDEGEEEY